MFDVFVSAVVFIISFISHVGLYRWLKKRGIKSFYTVLVFGLGLLALLIIELPVISEGVMFIPENSVFLIRLPLTGLTLFLLTSGLLILFFTAPYTNEISPSQKITEILKRHQGVTAKHIYGYFSEYELFEKRIQTLVKTGYLIRRRTTYLISLKGQRLAILYNLYRNWFKWK